MLQKYLYFKKTTVLVLTQGKADAGILGGTQSAEVTELVRQHLGRSWLGNISGQDLSSNFSAHVVSLCTLKLKRYVILGI